MYRRLSSLRIFETVTVADDRRLDSLRYIKVAAEFRILTASRLLWKAKLVVPHGAVDPTFALR